MPFQLTRDMHANRNPHVVSLLAWHGHAAGGVRVPFRAQGNPLGQTIETALVRRLRNLAASIAQAATSQPRWIFLVGGPGNGKSETVQAFLTELDAQLGASGALVRELTRRFSVTGVLPRRVEVAGHDVGEQAAEFAAKVGRLIVVQDATATESAQGNAARELADDIADLMTAPGGAPLPVFVACANRGLLARAMNEAYREFGANNQVTRLLANVIQVSTVAGETLAGLKPCWPLETDQRFACWPLDVESLLTGPASPSPVEMIISKAVETDAWEAAGRCLDCTSRDLCPFRQSSEWLRDGNERASLLRLLRRGELAKGQRWNFREAYSLVAELLVGQWSDFEPAEHPCDWVHQMRTGALATPPDVGNVLSLCGQLYPQAMFRFGHMYEAAAGFQQEGAGFVSQPTTAKVVAWLGAAQDRSSSKPIREILQRDYARLDPSLSTPEDPGHVLRAVEDAFCQSVAQGAADSRQHVVPSLAEQLAYAALERAEDEWDVLGRESAAAATAVCFIRKAGAVLAKRSIGVRLGYHALDEMLSEYEACLRDPVRLGAVAAAIKPLMGDATTRFSVLEVLGQPTAETQPLVGLEGPLPGIRAIAAPVGTETTPGHDIPSIEITEPKCRVSLTFEFFLAVQLRKNGCAGSSLPASVRAALDRVRQRYAGHLCRDDERFADGRASIVLGTGHVIGLVAPGAPPTLATR